ncbi:MAG TPA: hypothetical protein VF613_18460, partial [Longimicrobium sp.]
MSAPGGAANFRGPAPRALQPSRAALRNRRTGPAPMYRAPDFSHPRFQSAPDARFQAAPAD